MSLTLVRNKRDNQMVELIEATHYAGQGQCCVWAVVCVDAVMAAAEGELRDKHLSHPQKVVFITEAEWKRLNRMK